MGRTFRFYEKKRGDRRTGSKQWGSFGEALFFGFFFCVGCAGFLALLYTLVIPEFRANRHFVATDCTVLSKKLGARVEGDAEPTYRPEIEIRYEVDGERYEYVTYDVTESYAYDRQQATGILEKFQVGQQYRCWYDPIDPSRAVLTRGYSGWSYLFLLIPLSFMVIGGGGLGYTLYHWGTSAERRAALAQRAGRINLFEVAAPNSQEFPFVPGDTNLTNSPGTTLAYRLPIAASQGWALFAVLVACLLWNGIVSIFVVMILRGHLQGQPDWFLTMFITPFVLAGMGLIYYLIRQLLITTGVGPTRLEVADHPLLPGREYEVLVSQAGRLKMNSLELLLACDEKVTYHQGTDTRTDSQRVYEEQILLLEDFDIHQGMPFESRCQLRIPEDAMHSFKADHNEINWKLIVRGDVAGWPDYERTFPVVVYPTSNGNALE